MELMKKNSPGRPRDEASRRAILAAAVEVLKDRGYAGFALETVAKRAGTGKTTIYRWWLNRAALAVEAFFDDTLKELAFPDTGSTAEDFRQQLKQLANLLRQSQGQVLAALIIGSRNDEELRVAVAERWVRARQRWGRERMDKAVANWGVLERPKHSRCSGRALQPFVLAPLFWAAGTFR